MNVFLLVRTVSIHLVLLINPLNCKFCLFSVVSSSAQTNIPADLGQDVILPCTVPNNKITAVEWIRPDQDPEYVLFYRDGHLDPDNQHPSYQNQVDLQDKEMKDGDVSLILKNVTMEDNGTFECWVHQGRKKELISTINLEVVEPGEIVV
uniref:Ig-like domain-containing protein n=1 Tax=Acanthochromis polyacanthus TaxID=80966 RepID=A0A3Q1GVF5_9TELE